MGQQLVVTANKLNGCRMTNFQRHGAFSLIHSALGRKVMTSPASFFFSFEENVTKVDEESKVCLLGLVSMQYYFAHMLLFEIGSGGAQ